MSFRASGGKYPKQNRNKITKYFSLKKNKWRKFKQIHFFLYMTKVKFFHFIRLVSSSLTKTNTNTPTKHHLTAAHLDSWFPHLYLLVYNLKFWDLEVIQENRNWRLEGRFLQNCDPYPSQPTVFKFCDPLLSPAPFSVLLLHYTTQRVFIHINDQVTGANENNVFALVSWRVSLVSVPMPVWHPRGSLTEAKGGITTLKSIKNRFL